MQDAKQFREWVKWLRRHFPSAVRVRVEMVPASRIKGLCGYTSWDDSGAARVQIASTLSPESTLEALCHEWAHVRKEHLPESTFDTPGGHDSEFYGCLAKIDSEWRKHWK